MYQQAAAWDTLPMLQHLSVTSEAILPSYMGALWCAASITSLQIQLVRQQAKFDFAALVEPMRRLQQLCVFDLYGDVRGSITSLGSLAGISRLMWCSGWLSPLARTQLVTAAHLRVLFVDCQNITDEELEAMGHYMTKLAVLGVGILEVSLDGIVNALCGGRFPALQCLVVDCSSGACTEQEAEKRVADVRPQLAFETADFNAEGLRKYMM
jgi:hypothetical protein